MDTYRISADGSGLKKLSEEEAKDVPPLNGDWTKDKKRAIYAEGGDLFLYDVAKPKRVQLTKTTDNESNPHFTRDEKHITFARGGNLYMLSLEDATLTQLTEVQAPGAAAGAAPAAGGGGRGGQGRGGAGGEGCRCRENATARDPHERTLSRWEQSSHAVVRRRSRART